METTHSVSLVISIFRFLEQQILHLKFVKLACQLLK